MLIGNGIKSRKISWLPLAIIKKSPCRVNEEICSVAVPLITQKCRPTSTQTSTHTSTQTSTGTSTQTSTGTSTALWKSRNGESKSADHAKNALLLSDIQPSTHSTTHRRKGAKNAQKAPDFHTDFHTDFHVGGESGLALGRRGGFHADAGEPAPESL